MKNEARGKLIGIAVVVVLLLLGLGQITDLVMQRQSQRQVAINSVAQSLAGSQTLVGPLVHMACTEEWAVVETPVGKTDEERKGGKAEGVRTRAFTLMAPPATLTVLGSSQLEPRARGLHTTQVFNFKSTLTAQWNDLSSLKAEREHPGSRLQCGPVLLMLAVSDARGIRQIDLKLNGVAQAVRAGTFLGSHPRGIHTALPSGVDLAAPLTAELQLELVGTEQLALVPVGTANTIQLRSNWPHPSFGGQFLPLERHISDSGFDATWRVSALASTAQQELRALHRLCVLGGVNAGEEPVGASQTGCIETLGVTFMDPANTYALSNRATKYGLLFIVLTFVAVGLFELMRSLRVHPVQYFLVGAAIACFFLLLVSLSEQYSFSMAYAIAASACVSLLTYYASHILHSWKRGMPFGAGIATLYGLLYVLLRLEQKALVVGAVALFLVLASVMMLTRRVDWYARLQPSGGSSALGKPETETPM
ncbi:cell envelope integrity protein CreD [Rhodoferax sp.]|uniref:cell envelope integrity protein CreD n=1 Tax=Rhodoferax sp. TaxID=50421 RepID=UPI001ED11646|nr:cell envelope integrity protein CreD [Rhodoferax sp.]MBT9505268.1 cell envelope integrity protein CreD [Rhodoferax sp.]